MAAYLPARTALTPLAPTLGSLWMAVHVKQTSCSGLLDISRVAMETVRGADQVESRVLRVGRDGLRGDWGGRLGTGRRSWSSDCTPDGTPRIC